jgi:trehalose 6-phosphate synthase
MSEAEAAGIDMATPREPVGGPRFDLVVAANRLPVDRVDDGFGGPLWRRSPGGLVTAMEPVMRDPRSVGGVGRGSWPTPEPKAVCICGR